MNMYSVQLPPCPVGPEWCQEPSDSCSTKRAGKARYVGPECVTATVSGQGGQESRTAWRKLSGSSGHFQVSSSENGDGDSFFPTTPRAQISPCETKCSRTLKHKTE